MTIDKSGPLCDCGCYGCLEAIASANAISKQARFAISNGANSMMFDIIHGNLNDINAKVVFDAAKAGDSLANTIVNQVTVYLGIAISNVINLLDPQLIILGGGVSQAGDFLLNPLLDEVSRHVLPVKEPHIVISSWGRRGSHRSSHLSAEGVRRIRQSAITFSRNPSSPEFLFPGCFMNLIILFTKEGCL